MNQLVTFDYGQYCRLLERGDVRATAPVEAGVTDGLNLYLIEEGACGVAGSDALLAAGGGAASAFPLTLMPAGGCRVLWAALIGAAPGQVATGLAAPLFFAWTSPSGEAAGAASLLRLLADEALTDPLRQSALGYELLCRLARLPGGEPYPPVVAVAIALIRAHYAEVYGVEELAAELSVSKGHLIRSFRAATGLSPGRYLASVRLEAAKGLLLHRDYPLEVVAGLCGFSGANYLCRVFKKDEGMTPSAWRALNAPAGAGLLQPPAEWEESLYL